MLYKEFLVALRDPFTLFLMFFPAMVEMIAFGYALDTDVKHIPTVVLDECRTAESRALVDRFVNTGTFDFKGEVANMEELSATIRRGKAYVGLQFPPDFARNLRAGRAARVQVLIDGSNSTVAGAAINTSVALALRESLAQLMGEAGRRELPLEVRPQMLYNAAMRSPNFFLPGVIAIVVQIAMTFATAMSLVRERERGTLEQLLVSPLSRSGLMLGKLLPYLSIGGIMAGALLLVMRYLFKVPIAGPVWLLALSFLTYLFTLLSLGLLLSTRAQNQMQAMQMTMAMVLPSVFFSGFIFPRDTMPWIFQRLGDVLPATYFIELVRAIVLRGAGLGEFWHHLAVLGAMGLGIFVLCALRFRQRLA